MIKFKVREPSTGLPFYGFGLSHANLDRLREGKPIAIDLASMGGAGRVLIFAGKDEDALAGQLKPYITADTKILPMEDPAA